MFIHIFKANHRETLWGINGFKILRQYNFVSFKYNN